jgi:hypothetical protein
LRLVTLLATGGQLSDGVADCLPAAPGWEQSRRSRRGGAPIIFGEAGEGEHKGKSFGDWLLGVARGDRGYLEKHYGSKFTEGSQKAAMAEASGVTGGYTVPPEFYQGLMTAAAFVDRPRGCRTLAIEPKWRNWQTRRTQNPVLARECGFESHLRQSSGTRFSDASEKRAAAPDASPNRC